ncbi:hypothetical protein BGZ74_003740, partial [Mortierella antarctica]
ENSVRQNSFAQFMEQVEQHEGASYYHITSKMTFQPGTTQRNECVAVFKDNDAYFCTCLLRENAGIVCRHYLCALQDHNTKHKYHVGWISKRWFLKQYRLLSDADFAEGLQRISYLGAGNYDRDDKKKGITKKLPILPGSMAGIFNLQRAIVEANTVPTPTLSAKQEIRQFALMMGNATSLANTIKSNPEVANCYAELTRALHNAYQDGLRVDPLCGDEGEIRNPLVSVTKGRKKKSVGRIKASSEEKPAMKGRKRKAEGKTGAISKEKPKDKKAKK